MHRQSDDNFNINQQERISKIAASLLQKERVLEKINSFSEWYKLLYPSAIIHAINLTEKAILENENGSKIAPDPNDVFKALRLTSPERVKVVIIGQDPYHTPGAANGLAFSVNDGEKFQPSLKNIFKELHSDIGCDIPTSGELSLWANEGVLLLNAILTVYEGEANSCADWGWQNFTKDVIRACFLLPQPIIFLAWGRQAQGVIKEVQKEFKASENKICLRSSHPSPLGANKPCGDSPAFIGSKPFSTANRLLIEIGSTPINWNLD